MFQRYIHSPRAIGLTYLLLIPSYAAVYFFNPCFWKDPLSICQSLYFSVVTITTLGYGEITPRENWGRAFTASEALLGVLLIGTYLNAVAYRLNEGKEEKIKAQKKKDLMNQYQLFRAELCEAFLRQYQGNHYISQNDISRLTDFREFRREFTGNNEEKYRATEESFESDLPAVNDALSMFARFSAQVESALGSIVSDNDSALRTLNRYNVHHYNLQNLSFYQDSQPEYVAQHIRDVLAMFGPFKEPYDEDDIELAINAL